MSTDFASLAHSLRVAGRKRGIDFNLGHAQQLLACAFGYQTLAGYQKAFNEAPNEPARIDDDTHLLLDVGALQERAGDLDQYLPRQVLVELVSTAFSHRLPQGGVHTSDEHFVGYVQERLQQAVPENSRVASLIADMNVDDVAEVYIPFESTLAEIPSVGDLFVSPVLGFIRMTPDHERPYTGNRVDVAVNVSMERVGRRLIGLDLEFERVRTHDLDDGPMPVSRAWAYARLLGLSVHLTRQLDNVSEEPNTGNSGDGFYGYVIDFSHAGPEDVVQTIQAKHGTLTFHEGPNFFDDVEPDL